MSSGSEVSPWRQRACSTCWVCVAEPASCQSWGPWRWSWDLDIWAAFLLKGCVQGDPELGLLTQPTQGANLSEQCCPGDRDPELPWLLSRRQQPGQPPDPTQSRFPGYEGIYRPWGENQARFKWKPLSRAVLFSVLLLQHKLGKDGVGCSGFPSWILSLPGSASWNLVVILRCSSKDSELL